MKKKLGIFVLGIAFMMSQVMVPPIKVYAAVGTSYYFSSNGNDSNDGLSEATPWKSLSKIEDVVLQPGDKVFLEKGSVFSGTLKIEATGTEDQPIIVDSYGSGNAKPIINGTGKNPDNVDDNLAALYGNPVPNAGIYLYNASYITVKNIEVTNVTEGLTVEGTPKEKGSFVAGVIVENNDAEELKGITLDGLYVHDVTGILASTNKSKVTGGIGFLVTGISEGKNSPRFEDVTIENCTIERVNSTGIFFDGYFRWTSNLPSGVPSQYYGFSEDVIQGGNVITFRPVKGDLPEGDMPKAMNGTSIKRSWNQMKWSNVKIQNNLVEDTGKNAMIIRLTDETCVIEKNVVHDVSKREGAGNSVMSRSVYGTRFQYNEVYRNLETRDLDGCAFDADFYSPATIWQYNYSHDNNYGLITLCTVESDKDIKVRYNIDQNGKGRVVNLVYNFTGVDIHNNFFYIGKESIPTHDGDGISIIWETRDKTGANYTGKQVYEFYNNVVYSDNNPYVYYNISKDGKRGNSSEIKIIRNIDNNIFYGSGASIPKDITYGIGINEITDPKVFIPGSGGSSETTEGDWWSVALDSISGYKLREDSPARGSGKAIPNDIPTDLFGNTIINHNNPDIGPYQYTESDFEGYPTITFSDVQIERGSEFDPYEGVTAKASDGTVIEVNESTVTIEGWVDTNKVGMQYLLYSVTENGKTTKVRRSIKVVGLSQTDIVLPKADTYTAQATGDTNYSDSEILGLKQGMASNHRIIYFNFDLTDAMYNTNFDKVELRLAGNNIVAGFSADVGLFEVDSELNLDQITWNSENVNIKELSKDDENYITGEKVNQFKSKEVLFDVTDFVRAKIADGDLKFTIQIAALEVTTPDAVFHSSESTIEENKPALNFSGASGTDASAKNISLSVEGETIPLMPSFSSDITAYAANIFMTAEMLDVTVETKDSEATYELYLDGVEVSNPVPLKGVDSELKIKVYAQDAVIFKEYIISIRAVDPNIVVITTNADTYVEPSNKNNNYGDSTEMRMKRSTPDDLSHRISYVKFDLSDIDTDKDIEKAEIAFTMLAPRGEGAFKVEVGAFDTDANWGEMTLTWANQPSVGTNPDPNLQDIPVLGELYENGLGYVGKFETLTSEDANKEFKLDITELIRAKIAEGETQIAIRLVPIAQDNAKAFFTIYSKEGTVNDSLHAKLIVKPVK